ncbi:Late secretory pathway protein AVL9-like [Heracleum sosnowskyi]|uniref:Late secretory pathway protein AVL9-like n=1 Tax=Heracleum sosnowskyi TaxID=360622 RepID=A0AAD8HS31_9APIA|nr:Late secretory pathway protein AVL9-like [Heracleum sosnowskyi]
MNSSNSQISGGSAEECHSSESGWTMYICSPVDDDDDVDEVKNDVEDQYKGGGDVESDDSMVSDASSAKTATIKKKDVYHQEAKKDDGGQMKNSRKWMKTGVEKLEKSDKEKDKESTSMNAATCRSGNKVRRNWLGKKK